jgi:predicted transcriptional regulator
MYAESFVTNIDVAFRSRLKSDISKAFYRFYQGQYKTDSQGQYKTDSEIEITRLARAVNMNIEQEMNRLRSKVRAGLGELQDKGYLEAYEVTRDNRVIVSKAKDTAVNLESQILGKANIEYSAD